MNKGSPRGYFSGKWVAIPLAAGMSLPGSLVAAEQRGLPEELQPLEVTASPDSAPAALPSASTVRTISHELLDHLDFTNLSDVSRLVSNVAISQSDSPRNANYAIRGSHEITFHELGGGRTSAAYYVDDVPFQDVYGREFGMFAAESISIYKGPHGTAFGAPGPMGVFDVTTRRPGAKLAGEASYTFGSHDTHRGTLHTGGEIRPGLLFGIDLLYSESEGWFRDRLTGDPYGKTESTASLAKLIWQATEQLEITLTAGFERHDDDPAAYLPHDTSTFYDLSPDPDAYATGWQAFQALRGIWKEDGWQIKSITSHRESSIRDNDAALSYEISNPEP